MSAVARPTTSVCAPQASVLGSPPPPALGSSPVCACVHLRPFWAQRVHLGSSSLVLPCGPGHASPTGCQPSQKACGRCSSSHLALPPAFPAACLYSLQLAFLPPPRRHHCRKLSLWALPAGSFGIPARARVVHECLHGPRVGGSCSRSQPRFFFSQAPCPHVSGSCEAGSEFLPPPPAERRKCWMSVR